MNGQRGFTLLEVALAVVLFGLVTGVVFAAFAVAGGSFAQAGRITASSGEIRATYRLLANDLAAAYYSPYDERLRFDGRFDRLAFTVRGGARGFKQVWLAQPLRGEGLERVEVTRVPVRTDAFVRPEGESEVLLGGRVTFMYLDGRTGAWTSAWLSDVEKGLPAAVQIRCEPAGASSATGSATRGGASPGMDDGQAFNPAEFPPLIVPVGAGRVYGGGGAR